MRCRARVARAPGRSFSAAPSHSLTPQPDEDSRDPLMRVPFAAAHRPVSVVTDALSGQFSKGLTQRSRLA